MFSPRGPSTRSKATPFSPSLRGTPSKRSSSLFSSPRRGKERRSQVPSRSLQVSQILEDTSQHRVESFGVPLPVLITEALTLADRSTEVTAKIDASGWAWLVGGRKLFVWRCKPSTARGIQCKELTLPPSDLAHSAARVCVVAGPGETQPTACIAVSPEGVVRYWPNIAYEASTAEISAELKGEECASVTNFQPYGCLLATTTSSLLLLVPSPGQNAISCTALKFAQGMFSGIGRRMSSFIFGATQAQTTGAPLQALVAGEINEEEDTRPFYVLSDTHLAKWCMSVHYPEKLLYQVDVLRLFREAFARKAWDHDAVQLAQLNVWLLDMQLVSGGVMILGAGVNLDCGPALHYALGIVPTSDDVAPTQLEKMLLIGPTEKYEDHRQGELLGFHLLVPRVDSPEALVYNDRVIFIVPNSDTQPSDRMDLQSSADQLIGAGSCENLAVFFSSAHGMFCVTPQQSAQDSIMDEVCQDSLLRSEQSTMGFNMSQVADLSRCEDKLSRLKACFITSLSGNQAEVERMLEDLFSPAVMEAPAIDAGREMDRLVAALSSDLIDDYPTSDPRWAESSRQEGSSTSSLIIIQQLRDKVRAHDYFRSFLKKFHLWDKLTVLPVRDTVMCTRLLLCENVEKLEAAIGLREQDADQSRVMDVCIRRVLKQRGGKLPPGLSPHDIFFREVTRVQDLAAALLDYEMETLSTGITSKQCGQLVVTVNSLMQAMVTAALTYRQSKEDDYQGPSSDAEYIPWTSALGNTGLRTILSKQMAVTVERAIPETQDIETRGTLFQQLVCLADLLLDGYSCQLESLRLSQQETGYSQLMKKYEEERRKMIQPLLDYEQYVRAASLAEKYYDFDALIRICEATDNQDRLQRYVAQFADRGFSQHLFNWYLKEGKRGRLLSQPFAKNPELRNFLASDNTRYLSWLHEIGSGDFTSAHTTLMELARDETTFLAKKKTLLSLSKLSALATDEPSEELDLTVGAINEELTLIQLQEDLPPTTLEDMGMDPKNMRVLAPTELIRLYVGPQNSSATEMDYKKALDLLQFLDKDSSQDDVDGQRLYIWCQAILHDRDRWTDTSEDDPIRIRDETLFFRTVDLIFTEGEDLGQMLPSVQTLLKCDELGPLRENKHFEYLLKAGYEIIENVLHAS